MLGGAGGESPCDDLLARARRWDVARVFRRLTPVACVRSQDFTPAQAQNELVGGSAAWHPGNRIHKIRGRHIALVVLRTLDYALDRWKTLGEAGGFPIPEEHWHVNDYYKAIREKAGNVAGCWGDDFKIGQKRHLSEVEEDEPVEGSSFQAAGNEEDRRRHMEEGDLWPSRLCNLPLQGRSLWGPRYSPLESSLVAIMKPNAMGDVDPGIASSAYMAAPCYSPPDRPAPWTVPDAAEPFAPLIAGSRRLTVDDTGRHRRQSRADGHSTLHKSTQRESIAGKELDVSTAVGTRFAQEKKHTPALAGSPRGWNATRVLASQGGEEISPGLGLSVNWGLIGVCDGTSHHWCGKSCDSSCLMTGTQDNRGRVCFSGLSGWLVFDVKNVRHGFIGARLEGWLKENATPITHGWTSVNNGGKGNYEESGRKRRLREDLQKRMMRANVENMKTEIEADSQFVEGRRDRHHMRGGQARSLASEQPPRCGMNGDYTFEWAINGEIVSWTKDEFCERMTRLAYNFDVIKFMDDETKTGDFEFAMRISSPGVMCISHLYWS